LPFGEVGIEAFGILRDKRLPGVAGTQLKCQLIVASNGRIRVSLRSRRNRLHRHQRQVVATQGTVNVGLLLVPGILQHVVADKAESATEIETGLRQVLDQGGGVRTVLAVAV